MAVSATQLRQNIYALLDEALETGKPIEIERKGKVLRIVPEPVETDDDISDEELSKKFGAWKREGWVVGDVEDLIDVEWSEDFTKLVKKKPAKKRP